MKVTISKLVCFHICYQLSCEPTRKKHFFFFKNSVLYLFYGHLKSLLATVRFGNMFWKPKLRPLCERSFELYISIWPLPQSNPKKMLLKNVHCICLSSVGVILKEFAWGWSYFLNTSRNLFKKRSKKKYMQKKITGCNILDIIETKGFQLYLK